MTTKAVSSHMQMSFWGSSKLSVANLSTVQSGSTSSHSMWWQIWPLGPLWDAEEWRKGSYFRHVMPSNLWYFSARRFEVITSCNGPSRLSGSNSVVISNSSKPSYTPSSQEVLRLDRWTDGSSQEGKLTFKCFLIINQQFPNHAREERYHGLAARCWKRKERSHS